MTPIVALSGVPGLAGWWESSLPSGMLSASGTPLTAFGAPVAAVGDKSDAAAGAERVARRIRRFFCNRLRRRA